MTLRVSLHQEGTVSPPPSRRSPRPLIVASADAPRQAEHWRSCAYLSALSHFGPLATR